jgi:hypothetical protein
MQPPCVYLLDESLQVLELTGLTGSTRFFPQFPVEAEKDPPAAGEKCPDDPVNPV